MYDGASNGGRSNNDKFSPCSIRAIIKKLQSSIIDRPLIKGRNVNEQLKCLEIPKNIVERRPRCGDTVRQNQEQCDCGTPEECKISDPGNCCDPKTCKLRPGSSCSTNDGRCCGIILNSLLKSEQENVLANFLFEIFGGNFSFKLWKLLSL